MAPPFRQNILLGYKMYDSINKVRYIMTLCIIRRERRYNTVSVYETDTVRLFN